MIKILVADDEKIIAQSLCALIQESDLEIDIVGVAYDGEQAWDFIQKNKPDIVVLDITMPKITGIELLKLIRNNKYKTKVIILSAHRNFEYAQQALKYGALDYVVKPIDEKSFIDIVKGARSRCLEERKVQSLITKQKFQEYLQDQESFDNDLLNERILDFKLGGEVIFSLIKFVSNAEWKMFEKFETALYQEVSLCKLIWTDSNRWLLLSNKDTQLDVEILRRIADRLLLPKFYFGQITYKQGEKLQAVWKKLLQSVQKSFYEQDQEELPSTEKAFQSIPRNSILLFFKKRNMDRYMDLQKGEAIREIWEEWCNHAWNQCYLPEQVISEVLVLVEYLRGEQEDEDNQMLLYTLKDYLIKRLEEQYYESFTVLKRKVGDCLENMFSENAEIKDQIRVVNKAKAYLCQNYNKAISLEMIAEELYVSKNYLCNLFKAHEEKTCWDYLTEIRMKEAKKLLKNTEQRINQIALNVGYNNVSHFNRTFLKFYGITPSECRRKSFRDRKSFVLEESD